MHVAAMTGQTKVFQTMLEKAEDKNPKDDNLDTPLHSAAERGHYKICKLIIDAGIEDKNPSNKNNETPLELATANNHTEVGLLIRERVGSWDSTEKMDFFHENLSKFDWHDLSPIRLATMILHNLKVFLETNKTSFSSYSLIQ